jgi:hypothetical protein
LWRIEETHETGYGVEQRGIDRGDREAAGRQSQWRVGQAVGKELSDDCGLERNPHGKIGMSRRRFDDSCGHRKVDRHEEGLRGIESVHLVREKHLFSSMGDETQRGLVHEGGEIGRGREAREPERRHGRVKTAVARRLPLDRRRKSCQLVACHVLLLIWRRCLNSV